MGLRGKELNSLKLFYTENKNLGRGDFWNYMEKIMLN